MKKTKVVKSAVKLNRRLESHMMFTWSVSANGRIIAGFPDKQQADSYASEYAYDHPHSDVVVAYHPV